MLLSETRALTTARLHKAVGHCSEKLSQSCPETALELLQKKEDIVSQLNPLPHSPVYFSPRDENWGILTVQPLGNLLLRRWRKSFDIACNYEKASVRKWTKNDALVQCSWDLQRYLHPVVNIPQQLGIKLRMNIIWSGSLPRRST